MDFTKFLIGFHLFYCLFFKFANDLDCEQSLGLIDNLQAARRAVLFNGQGTGLGLGMPEVHHSSTTPQSTACHFFSHIASIK